MIDMHSRSSHSSQEKFFSWLLFFVLNIDNEFNLHLTVKTACVDEDGTSRFVLSYEYKIS